MNNFLRSYYNKLISNNFENPEIELRILLNKSKIINNEIILNNFSTSQIDKNLFQRYFERRIKKEPLAKIINNKEFWNYSFYVNEHVLDPRPETELIIDSILRYFKKKNEKYKIVDLGTGSGCIAITLAKEYINSTITATDISKSAIKVAEKNSIDKKTCDQIKFVNCNWIKKKEIYDIIVANPPYLNNKEYENYLKEYCCYEPKIALFGGKDGMDSYRKLAKIFNKIGNSKSLFFVEIGHLQKDECVKIFAKFSIKCIEIVRDYQSFDRVLILKKL